MIPPNFTKIMKDFVVDLWVTFPELKTNTALIGIQESNPEAEQKVFETVIATFPLCTMEILQEKETIFTEPRFFLPEIDFSLLWNDSITENTKKIIWKYLKLILFTILGHIDTPLSEEKIRESMEGIKGMMGAGLEKELEEMMGGKIGALAKEIAEETISAEDLPNLMKNPSSLFNLTSTIGEKIEQKIKSGQLKESELLEEAALMMDKMKDMPGMKQFQDMFGKMDMSGMKNKMDQQQKKSKMKERLQKKLKKKKEEKK
jgi:hypothetical protein